jgi:hypothetical protein
MAAGGGGRYIVGEFFVVVVAICEVVDHVVTLVLFAQQAGHVVDVVAEHFLVALGREGHGCNSNKKYYIYYMCNTGERRFMSNIILIKITPNVRTDYAFGDVRQI